jgi:hypothetical protein
MTTIILTATVDVKKNVIYMYQKERTDRINCYLHSVRQWLTKTRFNIILVENSGYSFQDELRDEKELYKDRFDVISFIESELPNADYLINNVSKGASEIFAINYGFFNSKFFTFTNFIIKITARFFIAELEDYLSNYDLNNYDCLTQQNRNRCEMIGSHRKHFWYVFNNYLITKNHNYDGHVENIWKERTSKYNNILICKEFAIEKTQRGGENECYIKI